VQWLKTFDVDLFRLINAKLANPILDQVMLSSVATLFFTRYCL